MRRAAAVAALLMLFGCSSTPDYPTQTAPPATPPSAASPQPGAALPILRMPGDLASPVPQPRAADACGAGQMQGLIGHPRSLIPVPLDPNRQRVACTTCPMAPDSDPGRLNFLFDARTGLIREVRCG